MPYGESDDIEAGKVNHDRVVDQSHRTRLLVTNSVLTTLA